MYRGGPVTPYTHIPVSDTHLSFMSGLAPHDQDSATLPVKSAGTTVLPTPSCQFVGVDQFGTDTTTTFGHPAFDAQELWGGHPSCDLAPLTTSFGTMGQWERRHRATAPTTRHNATCLCLDTASLPALGRDHFPGSQLVAASPQQRAHGSPTRQCDGVPQRVHTGRLRATCTKHVTSSAAPRDVCGAHWILSVTSQGS